LLQLAATGDRSTELKQALRQRTNGRACFVRVEDGDALDPVATMDCFEYVSDVSAIQMWGSVPVESLDEIWEKQREADPLSGEALVNGKAQDGVDWTNVPEQHRVYAAFGRLNNLLPSGSDRFTLVNELSQSNLTGRWTPIIAQYRRAEKTAPEKVAAARAALVYRKGGQPASGNPFRAQW
jgi:hypothetical protein